MTKSKQFWFLLNWQAWAVLGMGCAAALVTQQGWVALLGVIGYLLVLLFDILGGGSLDRSSYVRLAHSEQENRTLRAEQARLASGLQEVQARNEALASEVKQLKEALETAQAEAPKPKDG